MTEFPQLLQTVLDTTDVRGLAEFYRSLLGMEYRPGDEPPADGPDDLDWVVIQDPRGGRRLAFQLAEELKTTTWPSPEVPMQMHLDCMVDSLDALINHRDRALEMGAEVVYTRLDDPEEPLVVLADPAGHPFCLFVG